jgi:hypothetical protein
MAVTSSGCSHYYVCTATVIVQLRCHLAATCVVAAATAAAAAAVTTTAIAAAAATTSAVSLCICELRLFILTR